MIYPTKARAEQVAREITQFGMVYIAGRNQYGWTVYRLPYPGYWHSDRIE